MKEGQYLIMKYRTKPCEIEAIQWTGKNYNEIEKFVGDSLAKSYPLRKTNKNVIISTLEGNMRASINDYIIKGLRGEFYPCKPDVFAKK